MTTTIQRSKYVWFATLKWYSGLYAEEAWTITVITVEYGFIRISPHALVSIARGYISASFFIAVADVWWHRRGSHAIAINTVIHLTISIPIVLPLIFYIDCVCYTNSSVLTPAPTVTSSDPICVVIVAYTSFWLFNLYINIIFGVIFHC